MSSKRKKRAYQSQESTMEDWIKIYSGNPDKPMKFMLGLFKGQGIEMFKTLIFLILKESPVWVIPIVTAKIINIATNSREHKISEIAVCTAIALLFLLQNIGTSYIQVRIYSKVVRGIEFKLRGALVRKLQQLSISFHKEMQSGRMLSKIMRDVENVEMLLYQVFGMLVNIVLDSGIAIVVIAVRSPIVLVFFACIIPVAVLAVYVFRTPIRSNNREFRKEMEEAQASVAEMVEMIPVTRAHGLEKIEIKRIDRQLHKIHDSGYRLDMVNMLFGATSWVVFQGFQILCLAFTSILAYKGMITVGEVVLYQNYFSQIVNQIANLINIYPNLTKGIESIRSIGEIIGSDDVEPNHAIVPLGTLKGAVEFRDVCFQYRDGNHAILQNFNLKVQPGESVAFVGSSGAGKSTVLNLMIGFDVPSAGMILIDGINMKNLDMKEYRSQIAMVPQNTILFSGTIRDNIIYGLSDITDQEVWDVLEDVGLKETVEALPGGLDTMIGEHGGSLSGGQRQRISIARALMRKPRIIIFDEATSALDSESEVKVQKATSRMMKSCTTFMVAHRLSTIRDADRICVMDHGRIIEQGTYEELMEKKGAFYRLKQMQK